MTDEPELLTVAEAAAVLRISEASVRRAINAGTFPVPAFRPTPGRVLISRRMLDQYLATGEPVADSGMSAKSERLLALIYIADPWWYRPLVTVLALLPGMGRVSERLEHWRGERAVRLYRARSAS